MTRRFYSPEERAFIAMHYPTMSITEIGEALQRPPISIKLYASRNGLRKGGISASRFAKGCVPHNKGVKGWKAAGSEKGQFKKGHTPHNATGYYDGLVVTRTKEGEPPYRYRRLGKGRWVLSHRYNYEQMHGPIPKSHVLRCIDGNTVNDEATNWELITRQDNAARNAIHTTQRASTRLTDAYLVGTLTKGRRELRPLVADQPDLLEAQRLRITLNRTIKDVLESETR